MEINFSFIPSKKSADTCFDNLGNNNDDQNPKRKKKRIVARQHDQQIIECTTKLNKCIQQTQMFHIFGDLCINSQLQIKIGTIVAWNQIGFEYLSTQKIVTYDKFVDLQMSFSPLPSISLEGFAEKLLSIPSLIHQEFYKGYIIFKCYIRYMKKQYLLKNQSLEKSGNSFKEIKDQGLNQKRKRSQIDDYNRNIIAEYCSQYMRRKLKNKFTSTCNNELSSNQCFAENKQFENQQLCLGFNQILQGNKTCLNSDSSFLETSLNSNYTEEDIFESDSSSFIEKEHIENNNQQEFFVSIMDELEPNQDQSIQQKIFEIEEGDNKSEEYNEFSELCFKILKEKIVPRYSLYSYAIGRVDFLTNQIESSHMGYSKDFMQLICMDTNILENLFLRSKSYDLIQDHQMALEESLKILFNRNKEADIFESRIKLKTLDGFDLWVDQKYRKLIHTPHQKGSRFNYVFGIGELDIQLPQLEALIHYRQAQSSGNFNYDDFIKKELSYLLEDVEYSVQSQGFLEKYYSDKLATLAKLKEEQISKKIEPRSLCGFKKLIFNSESVDFKNFIPN